MRKKHLIIILFLLRNIFYLTSVMPIKHVLLYYTLQNFHTSISLIVFYMSLSDGKTPQVSRTLLSILADLNNAVVWMISARPPIINSSSPFTKPLGIILSTQITISIAATFIFHSLFSSLTRSKYLYLAGSFFINYHQVWSSSREEVICLYFKIPENFVHLILQDGLWFTLILSGSMIKLKFFVQFPV